jgi:hypothetical protein
VGSDSIVSIATRYRLDSPGIKSWCGWDFPHPSRPALHPIQRPVQWVTRSFPGVKLPRCGINNPITSSTVVKHRVELHLYFRSGPSRPITGCNLPFFLPFINSWKYKNTSILNYSVLSDTGAIKIHGWRVTHCFFVFHSTILFTLSVKTLAQGMPIKYTDMKTCFQIKYLETYLSKSILYYGCLCLNALLMLRKQHATYSPHMAHLKILEEKKNHFYLCW